MTALRPTKKSPRLANIAIESSTQVAAVRCFQPTEPQEVSKILLEHYFNFDLVRDLVIHGDIDILATTLDATVRTPVPSEPPPQSALDKLCGRTAEHKIYEVYRNTDEFVNENRTCPTVLYLYTHVNEHWEWYFYNCLHKKIWQPWQPFNDKTLTEYLMSKIPKRKERISKSLQRFDEAEW